MNLTVATRKSKISWTFWNRGNSKLSCSLSNKFPSISKKSSKSSCQVDMELYPSKEIRYVENTGAEILNLFKNSQFENHTFHKIHNLKISFFTKFTFSKSHFSQNSQFQFLIFHKIHIFKLSFFTKCTFLSIKSLVVSG